METMNGIEEYANAYSKEFCNDVIRAFEDAYDNQLTYFQNDIHKNSDDRIAYDWAPSSQVYYQNTNFIKHFYEVLSDVYKNHYSQKYNILTKLFQHTPKGMGIQRTGPGQGYHSWHVEQGNVASSNRIIAYLLYLNSIEDGGETEFLYQGLKIKPEQGKLVLFPTAYTYPHRGNPIYNGYKYVISGWFTFDH